MSKKIVLTGGGTAGHVNPNLALVPLLKEHGFEISYIGSQKGIEKEIIERSDLPFYGISSGKLRRYFSWENFSDIFRILKGYSQSKKILKKLRPDILFSKGGYVSVPVVFAANRMKIPVVIHESDYTPGLANRLCIPKARRVCVSFEAACKHIPEEKCVKTGSPVRAELFDGSREAGLARLGFSGKKPVLLIMGGSLGALAVNEAVDEILDALLETFDIVHIRGAEKLNPALGGKAGYAQFEYVTDELPDLFAAADLMLSRSGANAIFEILALCIPALLIPLPLEASRGDQILNANYFAGKGFSLVLQQNDITPQVLLSKIEELAEQSETLKKNMRESGIQNGAQNVAQVIFAVSKGK